MEKAAETIHSIDEQEYISQHVKTTYDHTDPQERISFLNDIRSTPHFVVEPIKNKPATPEAIHSNSFAVYLLSPNIAKSPDGFCYSILSNTSHPNISDDDLEISSLNCMDEFHNSKERQIGEQQQKDTTPFDDDYDDRRVQLSSFLKKSMDK